MQVKKKDGRVVSFEIEFVTAAISNAVKSSGIQDEHFPHHAAEAVVRKIKQKDLTLIDISQIQTAVEDVLMRSRYPDVAREYIQYRHDRDIAREADSSISRQIRGMMSNSDLDIANENANKDGNIIPTQRDLLAGIVSKHYAKHILPPEVMRAHNAGEQHFHDLDYSPFFPMSNCMLIDLGGMLERGFKIGNAHIGRPKSIGTATAVTAQIIAHVASHIYGGNTINRIDEVLAPYVTVTHEKNLKLAKYWGAADVERMAVEKTTKDVYDAFQGLEYEINSLHSSNGQTPFCTFGFGLGTSWESRLIQEAILKVRIAGLGEEKATAIFPKLVFALKRGLNLDLSDPQYWIKQLALECATKRMYPDIVSYDKIVEVTGSFKFPMGCRSFLHKWEDDNGVEQHEGRNNLGVVSLNLPRIALDANGDPRKFVELLDTRMGTIKQALFARIDRLRGVKAKVAPILYVEGACGVKLNPEDEIMSIFENGRASISCGYIGMHETCQILFGGEHILYNEIKQQFAIDILSRMKSFTTKWTSESGFAFSLYGTPSESLCERFCKLDKKIYGESKFAEIFEKGYYTNSFHLDVQEKTDPYSKIKFESQFVPMSTGGFICYGEFPNMRNNVEALEDVWNFAYDRVPYYGTNTPIDTCYSCRFEGEFTATTKGYECPNCGNRDGATINVTRRVCGYLGSPESRPFNAGKQSEVIRRVKHL